MRKICFIAVFSLLGMAAASAQAPDANMTCADYLKLDAQMGATPKTGDASADAMAADLDMKMKNYCKANPTAKATEAAEKAMMGN